MRPREGEVLHLGRRAGVADGDGVAGRGLPPHERERDRAVGGGDRDARQAADLLLAEPQHGSGGDRLGQAEAAQVAVRLAPVVEAGDRLLPDVAALAERHGALVEAGLLRDHAVIEVDAVARAAALDPHDLGGLLADLGDAERARHDRLRSSRGEHVDADVGRHEQDRDAGDLGTAVGVLVDEVLGAGDAPRVGADERQQRGLQRSLVDFDVAPELVAPNHVEQLLQGDALGVEQQLAAGVEHAQVAEHLALVREERGVAAAARHEPLDVVGDLALEERLGLGSGERELAALGAVDEAARVGQHVGVGDGGHPSARIRDVALGLGALALAQRSLTRASRRSTSC